MTGCRSRGPRWPVRHPVLAGGLIALAVLLVAGSWHWVLGAGALLIAAGLLHQGAARRSMTPARSLAPQATGWPAAPAPASPADAGPGRTSIVVETGTMTVWVVEPQAVSPASAVVAAPSAPSLPAPPVRGELAQPAERLDRRRLPARASGWG